MADKKISELVESTSPDDSDIIPIVDVSANATKKITATNLATYVNAAYPAETIRDTIGAMLTSNTETDITVTHDDGNDKINFVVSVAAANLPSAIDAAKIANGNISNAEFQSLDGMTGGTVQAQLNEKLPLAGGTMTGTLAMASQAITTSSTVDGRNLTTDGSKLDGIESNATADQTNAEIRTAVEAASDSNVFADADHTKLNAIEASADVTDATNVTAAGALMDSECANLAAVKGINQALTTSSSPQFTAVTADVTGDVTGNADTATALDNARTIGGVSFDGTGNINLPGVNAAGNQATSGNAATATALATARSIALGGEVTGSASFDGSSNVTITSTIAANSIGVNELALSEGSADQFLKTNGSGTISFASVVGATTINNAVANRLVSIASVTTDFDGEANLTFDGSTLGLTGNMTVSGTVDGADIAAMKTKLDAIESSATADQTNAEIRAAVEAATDSNVFVDADHTKLNAIEASATADQSDAEIRTAVEAASDSNVFTDADHSKLNGVAASANNYVHPNHSGEVTSTADGATVIVDNIVDEANLKVSNSPTNGYALTAQSGNTGGLTWAEIDISSALPLSGGTMTGNLTMSDNEIFLSDDGYIRLGDSEDLQIYHDSSNSYIKDSGTGSLLLCSNNLQINNAAASENMIVAAENGAVTLFYDNAAKLATASGGVTVTGDIAVSGTVDGSDIAALNTTAYAALPKAGGTMTGHLLLNDSIRARLGDGADFELYHDGSNSHIDNATGDLNIDVANDMILDAGGGDIRFYGGGSEYGKFNLSGNNLNIHSSISDGDVTIKGQDGNSTITALTIDMSDAGAATFNNNVTAYSDERLKSDIETIDNGLDKVSQMRGVTFIRDEKKGSGVIAQELEKIAPELVKTADDDMGTKSVAYGNVVGYLIEAIKELKTEVEELKEDNLKWASNWGNK